MKFSRGDVLVPKGKEYPHGALVADGYDDPGRLMAHPVGGGLQYCVRAEAAAGLRVVDDAERERALFRRGRFALADSRETFEGWSNGGLWNGWEMPRFERAVGERLLAWLGDARARFDAERDAFVTVSQDGEEEVCDHNTRGTPAPCHQRPRAAGAGHTEKLKLGKLKR